MLCKLIQHWLYQKHIQTENERHIVLYPSALNFGDFSCRIKQKTLSMFSPTIFPIEQCKYTFFVQYDALIMSIISSNIRKTILSETVKLEKYH